MIALDHRGLCASCPLFSFMLQREGGWARLGRRGPGISIHDRKRSPAPFSVRMGLVKEPRVGRLGLSRVPRSVGDGSIWRWFMRASRVTKEAP
jgi:hypothetical protein